MGALYWSVTSEQPRAGFVPPMPMLYPKTHSELAPADAGPVVVRSQGGYTGRVPEDWRERFVRAYDVEFQEWIDNVAAGADPTGPTAWDGYAAAVVSDAALAALASGARTDVKLADKPAFYG